jgi:hypothetical protein
MSSGSPLEDENPVGWVERHAPIPILAVHMCYMMGFARLNPSYKDWPSAEQSGATFYSGGGSLRSLLIGPGGAKFTCDEIA